MIKKDILWNKIKNVTAVVTAVVSVIMIVCVIVFVTIILTQKLSINIDETFVVSTNENTPMLMPMSFSMGKMILKGDADVTIPKGTEFPMRIKMKVSLDLKKIMKAKKIVSISKE